MKKRENGGFGFDGKLFVYGVLLKTLEEDLLNCVWSRDDFATIPPTEEHVEEKVRYFDPVRAAYLKQELKFWFDDEIERDWIEPVPETPHQVARRLLKQFKVPSILEMELTDFYDIVCEMYPEARKLLARNVIALMNASSRDQKFLEDFLTERIPERRTHQ